MFLVVQQLDKLGVAREETGERFVSAVFKSTSLLLLCLVCFFCLFVVKKQKLEMCLRTFLTVFLLHAVS